MNRRTHLWLNILAMSIVTAWFPTYASAHHTGTWKWTSTTENGQKFESIAKLKRNGRSFAGVYVGQKGQEGHAGIPCRRPDTHPSVGGQKRTTGSEDS